MTLKVIIADDETLSLQMMRVLLTEVSDATGPIEILKACRSGQEVLEAVSVCSADILFLDINMPAGDGMAVANALAATGGAVPQIIFTTAHSEYAAQAFDVQAVDYLLKPVERSRLVRAIERAKMAMKNLDEPMPKTVPIPVLGGIELLDVTSIESVEASRDYLSLNTAGRSFLIRKTLSSFAEETYPVLRQTHRSYLVNPSQVVRVIPKAKGEAVLCLQSGAEVPVSRRHRDVLTQIMNGT